MSNRYLTLDGSKKISDTYTLIPAGFDKVQQDVDTNKTTADNHIANADIHVTAAKKADWDSKAPGSTATDLKAHTDNADIHVTAAKKAEWDGKADGTLQGEVDDHIADMVAHLTKQEHEKLTGIEEGAQKNQNAFIKVNDISASSTTDQFFIVGGVGITISTDPVTKKVTVTATGEATPGPHGSSHDSDGSDPIPDLVELQGVVDDQAADIQEALSTAQAALSKADASETPAGAQAKVDALAGVGNTKTVKQVDDTISAHLVDYVKHPADGGTTGGTGTAYTASSSPNPSVLVDKIGIVITAHLDSGANPTLKWGTLTAYPMLKANGSPATIKKDGIYTWRFNATKSAFILQGEGSEERTGNVTGQSISRSGTTLRIRPQEGYYPGDINNSVQFSDPNWIAANIMEGKDIFGLVGTLKTSKYAEGSGTRVKDVPLTVNNLSFTPLLVVYTAYGMIGSSPFAETTVAVSDNFFYGTYSSNTKTPSIRSNISSSGSFYNSAAAEISLTANGFSKTGGVPFDTGAAYSWRAFG